MPPFSNYCFDNYKMILFSECVTFYGNPVAFFLLRWYIKVYFIFSIILVGSCPKIAKQNVDIEFKSKFVFYSKKNQVCVKILFALYYFFLHCKNNPQNKMITFFFYL